MRYCFALDLKKSKKNILAYEAYHQKVWPEIVQSIRDAGITNLQIYRVENRLFMIMETTANFSLAAKSQSDKKNRKVQAWEKIMENYQQLLPNSKPGEKWRLMELIYAQ